MKRRQTISDFINSDEFEEGSRPDRRTVIAAIRRGAVQGEFYMGRWWVFRGQPEQAPAPTTGDPIADTILRELRCG